MRKRLSYTHSETIAYTPYGIRKICRPFMISEASRIVSILYIKRIIFEMLDINAAFYAIQTRLVKNFTSMVIYT